LERETSLQLIDKFIVGCSLVGQSARQRLFAQHGLAAGQALSRVALAFHEGEKRRFVRVGFEVVVAEVVLVGGGRGLRVSAVRLTDLVRGGDTARGNLPTSRQGAFRSRH
jgi:hypothetical protein